MPVRALGARPLKRARIDNYDLTEDSSSNSSGERAAASSVDHSEINVTRDTSSIGGKRAAVLPPSERCVPFYLVKFFYDGCCYPYTSGGAETFPKYRFEELSREQCRDCAAMLWNIHIWAPQSSQIRSHLRNLHHRFGFCSTITKELISDTLKEAEVSIKRIRRFLPRYNAKGRTNAIGTLASLIECLLNYQKDLFFGQDGEVVGDPKKGWGNFYLRQQILHLARSLKDENNYVYPRIVREYDAIAEKLKGLYRDFGDRIALMLRKLNTLLQEVRSLSQEKVNFPSPTVKLSPEKKRILEVRGAHLYIGTALTVRVFIKRDLDFGSRLSEWITNRTELQNSSRQSNDALNSALDFKTISDLLVHLGLDLDILVTLILDLVDHEALEREFISKDSQSNLTKEEKTVRKNRYAYDQVYDLLTHLGINTIPDLELWYQESLRT